MSRFAGSAGRTPVVVAVEQALSMPYATLRFVHLGWRVIRIEAASRPNGATRGDPNRHIGRRVPGADFRSYFVAPNAGKEAIALDLKQEEGRAILQRLVLSLGVDVFCTNTLPAHHAALGITHEALSKVKPDLVWCAISALGTGEPDVPGYDPMLQALCGYMDLTGEADGPPLQCGPPLIDLKAGDEAFAQVLHALWMRDRTGEGARLDVSMGRAAVSWLLTFLPMLELGSPPAEVRRSGNQHRQFIPVNAYPTSDGYLYVAIGSDLQWARFVAESRFAPLAEERFRTNEGRRAAKDELHRRIAEITRLVASSELAAELARSGVPHAPITPIERVADLPFVAAAGLATVTPAGTAVRLPPAAMPTSFLERAGGRLSFAPGYGQHTDAVLTESGIAPDEIGRLRERGIVA